ncbi:hypothetical protein CR513_22260, partial [Mucuna pruriens]
MDAYFGYNQIRMHPQDEEKMTFIIDNKAFCYKRLMERIFKDLIGRNLEVYIDDMVITSTMTGQHYEALAYVFVVLKKHMLKLNLKKCSFEVIINMRSPKSVKEVQQLAGRIKTLACFLSRSTKTTLPIFHYL